MKQGWHWEEIQLPLKSPWKIHHGSALEKQNGIVSYICDGLVGKGEVAAATGSGLMPRYQQEFKELPDGPASGLWKSSRISAPLRNGLEMAYSRWWAQKHQISLAQVFQSTEPKSIATSFSMPILPLEQIGPYNHKNQTQRFQSLKVKIGHDDPLAVIEEVAKHYKGPLRVDANGSFATFDAVRNFLKRTHRFSLQLLEQPFAPGQIEDFQRLKAVAEVPIVADESIQDQDIDSDHGRQFAGVNIKLMKAGGIGVALRQIQQAKNLGLKVMVGCMVETSLGISGAFALGDQVDWYDLDGFLLLKEDPFRCLTEKEGFLQLENPESLEE